MVVLVVVLEAKETRSGQVTKEEFKFHVPRNHKLGFK